MEGNDIDAARRARADRSAPGRPAGPAGGSAADLAAGARRRAAETKRRRTRAAILRAAGRLFEEQGGEATTMDQIAAEAGVSPAALYLHFPNKWQVAAAALAGALAPVGRFDTHDLAGRELPEVMDGLLADIVQVHVEHASSVRVTVAALLASSRARGRADLQQLQTVIPTVPTLTALIRLGQDSGVFHGFPAAPDAALLIVHAMVLHIALQDDRPAELASLHIRGLAARLLGYEPPIAGGAGSSAGSGSS